MPKHKQLSPLSLMGIAIAIIGLALSVYAITQSTEFRQRASVGAVLYITGTPESVVKGQKISVSLDVETNAIPIRSTTVILTYPQDKLIFEKMDYNNSPFDMAIENIKSNGYIRLTREASSPVNGKNHIVTIHFEAKEPVLLSEIKPVNGTAILNTENKNIYTNAISREGTTSNYSSIFNFGFYFKFLAELFKN